MGIDLLITIIGSVAGATWCICSSINNVEKNIDKRLDAFAVSFARSDEKQVNLERRVQTLEDYHQLEVNSFRQTAASLNQLASE